MSNLGDSNTPIEGESFGLPAGAQLAEDANGNLAIADSSGSIVLVRDETNAEWQFENTDLTGINAINASSATLDSATVANNPTANDDVVRKTETDAIQTEVDGKAEQSDFDGHGNTYHNPNFAEDPHGSESHDAAVLHDGEDFDGQSTSSFSNLLSINLQSGTLNQESTQPDSIVRFSQLSSAQNIVEVQSYGDLQDPTNVSEATIFYVADESDYVAPVGSLS